MSPGAMPPHEPPSPDPPPGPDGRSPEPGGPGEAGRPPAARATLWTGVVAFWVVGPALYLLGGTGLLDAILLAVLVAVMPAFAVAQATVLEQMPFDRLSAYWSSIATLWIIGTTSWLVGSREGGSAAVGLVPLPALEMLAWSVGLAASGLVVLVGFRWLGRKVAVRESRMLARLLPRTRREKRVFSVLSFAAGAGEEIAYRGYVIPMLAPLLGLPGSAVASSVVFGVLHAYQGLIGIVRTALMGLVLAGGFLLSGSLIPSMLAHTLIDLVGGLVLADWFLDDRVAGRAAGRRSGSAGDGQPPDSVRRNGQQQSLAETRDVHEE